MTRDFQKFWIKVVAIIAGGGGPILFLGSMTATMEPARLLLDLASWPLDGATTYNSPDTRFLSALSGGFLMGWGVLFWCLSSKAYDLASEDVRKACLYSLYTWFIVDSAGSIASGNPSNAFFNLILLLIMIVPLLRPAEAG
jgi:hypothetical protein